jgi:hypothetical protein
MKEQKQHQLHDPGRGVRGSCWSTCIAMLLDLDARDVPVFAEQERWWHATLDWLQPRGYSLVRIPESESFIPSRGAAYIVNGKSPRGVPHSIVRLHKHGAPTEDYDPHPSSDGLESVDCFVLLVPCGKP